MSANKENVNVNERCRLVTKGNKEEMERNPLKTLSFHGNAENCLAGPSQGSSKLDTRHVTHKKKYYDSKFDMGFVIYKEKTEPVTKTDNREKNKNNEKIIDLDKPSNEKRTESNIEKVETEKLTDKYIEKKKVNTEKLGPVTAIIIKTPLVIIKTPSLQLNVNTVKRVKRSLKRPQARENRSHSPVSAKSCQFSIFSSNDIKVHAPSSGESFDSLNPYVLDNLNYLLRAERRVFGEPRIRNASRSCVINWIVNVNGTGGNPAVVQLAAWYFDCYLSTTWVTVNRLQVIAAACFWIATKFHGRHISAKRLVRYSGHAFIERELEAAERSILKKMQFQPLPVAPNDFVPYFSWRADRGKAGLIEAAAVFLCQCGIMTDKTLSEEYPSVVAAAAVRNALLLLRMDSCWQNLHACPLFNTAEKKAVDLKRTCSQLRDAVRVVASVGYEYKAPLFKFSGPPYYISNNIVRAVSYKDIMLLDA